ncbi:MAG: phage tail sheath family protein [Synechococcus sp.]
MPTTPTYPGVYIEEIPSGVRTITGVATSIAAFIGRTLQGPVNEPTTINSYGDFERLFGGLHEEYLMSYAVKDFYQNGGSQALIVRLIHPNFATDGNRDTALRVADLVADEADGDDVDAAKTAMDQKADEIIDDADSPVAEKEYAGLVKEAVATAAGKTGVTVDDLKKAAQLLFPRKALLKLPTSTAGDPLKLEAASEGEWGNALRARVDYDDIDDNVADRYQPLTKDDLFNLTIRNMNTGDTERFLNLTVRDSSRRVDRVLENESNLLRVSQLSALRPKETDDQTPALTDEEKKIQPFSEKDTKRSVGVSGDDLGSNGGKLDRNDFTAGSGLKDNKRGLYALDKADLFNLLCIPPEERGQSTTKEIYQDALPYCQERRAMLIVDSPAEWSANKETAAAKAKSELSNLGLTGEQARNAALFFPRVIQSDPKREGQLDTFVPCGIIAGVMARTDTTRGVWKAPAGIDATLNGIQGLEVNLNDPENGMLNPLGINCLRFFPVIGRVVWGSRTLRGADQLADEYKYIPIRRLVLFIEESLYRGTQWVVFEPNDEPLWAQIRLNIGAFMQNLFRQGAFQGSTPRESYFVKCDKETTPQNDINLGIVNIVVGFAPLKPAEFVIIKIQQMAGQIAT